MAVRLVSALGFFILFANTLSGPIGNETPENPGESEIIPKPELPSKMVKVLLVKTVDLPKDDSKILRSPCHAGYPMLKQCQDSDECPQDFECMGRQNETKACCLKDAEISKFGRCPEGGIIASNNFCQTDKDCGGSAKCVTSFPVAKDQSDSIPNDQSDPRSQDPRDQSDPKRDFSHGVCCMGESEAKSSSDIPSALKDCPTDYVPSRRAPCGLGSEGCGLGSMCVYTGTNFGRCCSPMHSTAKMTPSNIYSDTYCHTQDYIYRPYLYYCPYYL